MPFSNDHFGSQHALTEDLPLLCCSYPALVGEEEYIMLNRFPQELNLSLQIFHGISPGGKALQEPTNSRDLGPALKPYENHTEGSVTHTTRKQGGKEVA